MIAADQLDDLCVLTYRIVQGDAHTLSDEDLELLNEIAVHAEDVINSAYNEVEINDPNWEQWHDQQYDPYDEEYDPFDLEDDWVDSDNDD